MARKKNIEKSGLENQVGHLLRRVFHKARGRMQKKIAETGLSPMQTAAMTSLRKLGPTSQNKLGRRIGMEPGNVHGLVDRLLKKGMITSKFVDEGPGLHILDLTEEGQKIVDMVIPLGAEANKETLAPLSPEEQEQFMDYLRRLL
ncbi:MAG: winged helix-turn-helix transcriptional regulator [Kordiimonadaceae bacterium]|nr:winged helix-turn-helix transcriptional regulator [Alphaproteobacteria bacterium]MCP5381586.1 winged helix-turn-helix transcriptional regulator [Kordiimonadaceae bacterium]HPF47732.1 MarR family winged helix-turn-helix transcriptional regulator [Emcibacteraceae bacterium]HRW28431.1 MarR family winged helix-turn-helix transcriptional regulator [Emcibacteraceae bacterium]